MQMTQEELAEACAVAEHITAAIMKAALPLVLAAVASQKENVSFQKAGELMVFESTDAPPQRDYRKEAWLLGYATDGGPYTRATFALQAVKDFDEAFPS